MFFQPIPGSTSQISRPLMIGLLMLLLFLSTQVSPHMSTRLLLGQHKAVMAWKCMKSGRTLRNAASWLPCRWSGRLAGLALGGRQGMMLQPGAPSASEIREGVKEKVRSRARPLRSPPRMHALATGSIPSSSRLLPGL